MSRKPDTQDRPRQARPLQPQPVQEAPGPEDLEQPVAMGGEPEDEGELPDQEQANTGEEEGGFEETDGETALVEDLREEDFLGEAEENPDPAYEVAPAEWQQQEEAEQPDGDPASPEASPDGQAPEEEEEEDLAAWAPNVPGLPPDIAAALAEAIAENAAEMAEGSEQAEAAETEDPQEQKEPVRMAPRPSNPLPIPTLPRRTAQVAIPVPLTSPQALRATQSHRLTHRVPPLTSAHPVPAPEPPITAHQIMTDPGTLLGVKNHVPSPHPHPKAVVHGHAPHPNPWPQILLGAGVGVLLGFILAAKSPLTAMFGLHSSREVREHTLKVLEEERNQVQLMLNAAHPETKVDLRLEMRDFRTERQRKAPEDMTPKDFQ